MRNRKALRAASYVGWIVLLLFFVWTAALAMKQDAQEGCRSLPQEAVPAPVLVGPHGFIPAMR